MTWRVYTYRLYQAIFELDGFAYFEFMNDIVVNQKIAGLPIFGYFHRCHGASRTAFVPRFVAIKLPFTIFTMETSIVKHSTKLMLSPIPLSRHN